jgi:hypothetical protein
MILSKTIVKGITTYRVDKILTDTQMLSIQNTQILPKQIKLILDTDADVYTADDVLLLSYRTKKLHKDYIKAFYDATIKFAMTETSNRGSASGSKIKTVLDNPKIKSNIFGYFDTFAPKQKLLFKQNNIKNPLKVRECRFNMDFPDNYKRTLPYIKQIDELYKKYLPKKHKLQIKKANQTHFKIGHTSFTTITTNVNYQTYIHTDKGDDVEGFGNLTVIEDGKYSGAETCFPQYGVGVNVRTGDILFMNVHEWHGNLPMVLIDKDAIRMSIVCYLRYNVWKNTKGQTKKRMKTHNNMMHRIRKTKKKTFK